MQHARWPYIVSTMAITHEKQPGLDNMLVSPHRQNPRKQWATKLKTLKQRTCNLFPLNCFNPWQFNGKAVNTCVEKAADSIITDYKCCMCMMHALLMQPSQTKNSSIHLLDTVFQQTTQKKGTSRRASANSKMERYLFITRFRLQFVCAEDLK